MKKIGLVIFLLALFQVSVVFGAPIVALEDAIVNPGDTSVEIDLWILTDPSSPVDSAAFTDAEITDFNLTGVSFEFLPGWISGVLLPKFGSTDFSSPALPITSDILFATLTYTFAPDFFQPGDEVDIQFSFVELVADSGMIYQDVSVTGGNVAAVPIPSALLLLGTGLVGLLGLRRRAKK